MRKCTVINYFLIHIVDTNSIDNVFRIIFTITSIKIEYLRFILTAPEKELIINKYDPEHHPRCPIFPKRGTSRIKLL